MSYDFNFTESGYSPPIGDVDFNFGTSSGTPSNVYNILKGLTNNFVAISADATTSYTVGKFYVTSSGVFNVVDMVVPNIYDYYTQSYGGRAREVLDSNDIVDIDIGV